MYKLTDKWIEACAEGPVAEGDELAQGVQQMARELLVSRQLYAIVLEERDYLANQIPVWGKRLAAAERVVETSRYVSNGIEQFTDADREHVAALDAYDKVVKE